jgi:hypothetical protein
LHGGFFHAALLPRDLRGELPEGLHPGQRLPPRDLLQVACTGAAPRAAAIHRAAEVRRHSVRRHVPGLPLAELVLRLPRVQRLLGSGELHGGPDLLELRLVPIRLLREPELFRVLQGLYGERGELLGDALLRELRGLPVRVLRQLELLAVLPGVLVERRKLHRRAQLRQLRRLCRVLRHVQQHQLRGLHPGGDELHRHGAQLQLLEQLVLLQQRRLPQHGVHLDREHVHVLGDAVGLHDLPVIQPLLERGLRLVGPLQRNAHRLLRDHVPDPVPGAVGLQLERPLHGHADPVRLEHLVHRLRRRVRLRLELDVRRHGDALQREREPERMLRGGGLLLVDRDDDLRGVADCVLAAHDGGVLVAARVLGAIGGVSARGTR